MNRIGLGVMLLLLFGLSPAIAEDPAFEIGERRQGNGALSLFQQGVELAQKQDYREALARFDEARKLAPNWALPYLEIAVVHLSTDNDQEAIGKALVAAVQLGKDIPRAHYLYGVFLHEAGRRSEAVLELTRALQIRPSLVDARYRLAALYVEEGRQAEGIQQYEFVLQQRGAHLGARRDLALLYEQSGQLEKAEEQLRAIAALYPGNAYYLNDLGKFYERAGFPEKARAAFKEAERRDPSREHRKLRPLLKSKR